MKNGFLHFLKILILLIAAGAIFSLIKFPLSEGRAANLDLMHIYLDFLIIYGYIASIPFFIILLQIFKLLGLIEKDKTNSSQAAHAFKIIKYSAIVFIGFIIFGLMYIRLFANGDDPAGPTGLGILVMTFFGGMALVANYYEKKSK